MARLICVGEKTEIVEMLTEMKFGLYESSYLIKLPMNSVSKENVDKILKEKADTEYELEVLVNTTIENMWKTDLIEFENQYDLYKAERTKEYSENVVITKKRKRKQRREKLRLNNAIV
jgi:hypothetical protein